jgi:hypothetical protein
MKASPQYPRTIFASLILFGGWLNILFGAFLLLAAGKDALTLACNSLTSGAAFLIFIYYRERRQRLQ